MANIHRAFVAHTPGKVAFKRIDKTATLDTTVTPTLAGEAYTLDHGELNEFITPTLVGVGETSPNYGFTDASVTPTIVAGGDVEQIGTLDKSVTPTLAGVGAYGQNATLDKPIVLTSTTYGSVENYGTLDRRFAPNWVLFSTGVGKVTPISGVLGVTLPLTITAQGGTTSVTGTLAESLLLTSASAEARLSKMHCAVTMPLPTISSELDNPLPNDLTLPALTLESTVATGTTAEMEATLPMLTIEIDLGHDSDLYLPALTIDAVLEPGNYLDTDVTLPPLTVSSQLDSAVLITTTGELPALISSARMEISGEILSAATLPALQIESTASSGNVANVSILLPVLSSTGILAENGVATLTQTLPSLFSNAQLHNGATAAFNPYVMNTENYTVAQYDNYNFHSVFERAGKYYGVNTVGIYELAGANDNGTAIAASFKLGFSDMKKAGMKRIPYVYLGYTSDGDVSIDVSIDGEPAVRQYTVGQISHTSGIKRGRAKIARGLKSRYWQFGVSNVAGADFEIEELGFFVQQFDRKAQ